jgi:hypothetical protein
MPVDRKEPVTAGFIYVDFSSDIWESDDYKDYQHSGGKWKEPEWHPYIADLTTGYFRDHPRYDWEYLIRNTKKAFGWLKEDDEIPF